MSVHDDLLAREREDREKRAQRQTLIARYNVREAIQSLPEGHPAANKLVEALALLETN